MSIAPRCQELLYVRSFLGVSGCLHFYPACFTSHLQAGCVSSWEPCESCTTISSYTTGFHDSVINLFGEENQLSIYPWPHEYLVGMQYRQLNRHLVISHLYTTSKPTDTGL